TLFQFDLQILVISHDITSHGHCYVAAFRGQVRFLEQFKILFFPLIAGGNVRDQERSDDDGKEEIQDNEYLADCVHDRSPIVCDSNARVFSRVPESHPGMRRISVYTISPKMWREVCRQHLWLSTGVLRFGPSQGRFRHYRCLRPVKL